MIQFAQHNHHLRNLIKTVTGVTEIDSVNDAVNLDTIDAILRKYLNKDQIYSEGSFFTGQELATVLVDAFDKPLTFSSIVLDPTCGAGNLLIECSRRLGIEVHLSDTLKKWGNVLRGYDIHGAFVEASKLRLVVEALRRGCMADCSIDEAMSYFRFIKVKDAMQVSSLDIRGVTHLIMNPPFNLWSSLAIGIWKKGKINAAGIIFEYYVSIAPECCSLCAILPDVLRSGTRYQSFRKKVGQMMLGSCRVWGRFNQQVDVDVFILSGHISSNPQSIVWYDENFNKTTIADQFDVCVGPLVAYRDPEIGSEYPYVHAKNVTKWSEVTQVYETRYFSGKVIAPPFVVIKRTSSPTDIHRASAAVINLKAEAVAVENHLIVLKPKSGKLKDCTKIIKILASKSVNDYLNQRIRMRHLTVAAVKSIPLG